MRKIYPIIGALVAGPILFYLLLPPVNIKSVEFCVFVMIVIGIYIGLSLIFNIKDLKLHIMEIKIALGLIGGIFLIGLILSGISSKLFNASSYQRQINVVDSDFVKDISEVSFSQIPVVDKETAIRLGSRKIGEVVELVSQFNVSNLYTQINFKNKPTRVTPLEYAGFVKWLTNNRNGIPYYVMIDMASQQTTLVKLDNGMKYSFSEHFGRNLPRHLRFRYPTKMFEDYSFEIDENGHPYWIVSEYDYSIMWNGGKDIRGVVVVDAITGDTTYHSIAEVPQWIDRAYPSELVIEQANNWGMYKNGYFNSIFGQKGVLKTTDGYNYLAINDDVWMFTGLTSVVSDESNIGFILSNLRTKETKFYPVNGAEEYSAMSSAEGKVQEKSYISTFPILLNVANHPTYFMSLKDNAGLVKLYSFVSVSNYQIVGVGEDIASAQKDYIQQLSTIVGIDERPGLEQTNKGAIESITSAVKEGNTIYFIKLTNDSNIYIASIKIDNILPLLKPTDVVTIESLPNDGNFRDISSIKKDL